MLAKEDNELITDTNPGTPMGEVFRRFWLPVALADELPSPDSVPLRLKVMNEDLIAFRDTNGNVGLMDANCPHRGAPMFFGRNEEAGLRCVYHGWKFDVSGRCVDIPNMPEGDTYRDKIKIKRYPVVEKGDLLWAYMGPADQEPPFPHFQWADMPRSHRYVTKYRLECNYLQAMEGDFDQTHARFLHSTLDQHTRNPGNRLRGNGIDNLGVGVDQEDPYPVAVGSRRVRQLPWTDLHESDIGMWLITAGEQEDGKSFATAHSAWMMPIFSQIGLAGPNTNGINMRVPIDNASIFIFRLRWSYDPIPESEIADYRHSGYSYPEMLPGSWTPKDNIHNDYNIDRVAQRNFSYTGIRAFPTQDTALIENQWGPIADRTQEHLGSSDQQIIHIRRRLIATAKSLAAGNQLSEPFHAESFGHLRARVIHDGTKSEAVELAKEHAMRPTPKTSQRVVVEAGLGI
ncbi:MAG TPA: Rieske 2Fe-2S domain-containing protein [Dehalococcoidia bacterium]|nr:Rieske 2Fe-2S domain-containing protein [Dehalococcoidia bacterium]